MTRRGGAFAPPLPIDPRQAIFPEDSSAWSIAGRDAAAEAEARARALAADLEAVAAGRWPPEPALLATLARLAEVAAGWARAAVEETG